MPKLLVTILGLFILLLIIIFKFWILITPITTEKYDCYSDIPDESNIFWFPEYYPKNSKDIELVMNVESNYYYSYFSLDHNDINDFESMLAEKSGLLERYQGLDYFKKDYIKNIIQSWCVVSSTPNYPVDISIVVRLKGNRYHLVCDSDQVEMRKVCPQFSEDLMKD